MNSLMPKPALTREERQAVDLIRKTMRTKPEIIFTILDGQSRALAGQLLVKARDELNQLMEVTRAFSAAAQHLAGLERQDDLPNS